MYRLMKLMVGPMLALLVLGSPVAAAQEPIVLEFKKQFVSTDYYAGTLDGGGTIEMWLFDKDVIGNTQHFSATVAVNAPDGSLTATVSGKINFSTGKVALNGTVSSGWLAGARVHEESRLLDPSISYFEGTIRIMPASS